MGSPSHNNDEKENLRLEYQMIKESITQRAQRLYLADTIIISVAILILLESFTYRDKLMITLSFPIGAILHLFVICLLVGLLLLHYSAVKVQTVHFDTLKTIENDLTEGGFRMQRAYDNKLRGKWWFEMRKWIWPSLILLIIFVEILTLGTFLID